MTTVAAAPIPDTTDPGQPVSWSGAGGIRSGVIWSDGPLPRSLWVLPDDGTGMVAVILPTKLWASRGHGPAEMPDYGPGWQRLALARVASLAARQIVTEEQRYQIWEYGTGNVDRWRTIAYHSDRGCPQIQHEVRDRLYFEPSVASVTRCLMNPACEHRDMLCGHCIWLDGEIS